MTIEQQNKRDGEYEERSKWDQDMEGMKERGWGMNTYKKYFPQTLNPLYVMKNCYQPLRNDVYTNVLTRRLDSLTLKMEELCSTEMLVLFTTWHGVTSQKIWIFFNIALSSDRILLKFMRADAPCASFFVWYHKNVHQFVNLSIRDFDTWSPIPYHCFNLYVTGSDQLRWDHMVVESASHTLVWLRRLQAPQSSSALSEVDSFMLYGTKLSH